VFLLSGKTVDGKAEREREREEREREERVGYLLVFLSLRHSLLS
jgi:hypothetical protein